jgi:hypothetical protein
MKNLNDYKKRFYKLMESTIGDVKPLISEQGVTDTEDDLVNKPGYGAKKETSFYKEYMAQNRNTKYEGPTPALEKLVNDYKLTGNFEKSPIGTAFIYKTKDGQSVGLVRDSYVTDYESHKNEYSECKVVYDNYIEYLKNNKGTKSGLELGKDFFKTNPNKQYCLGVATIQKIIDSETV